jgi:hypothetical protein
MGGDEFARAMIDDDKDVGAPLLCGRGIAFEGAALNGMACG